MNKGLSIIILGLFFAMILGCSSSGTVKQDKGEAVSSEQLWTLREHLMRKSGVQISGSGASTRVLIRGQSSNLDASGQPLFVIDGNKVGRSFNSADQMLGQGEIKSVEVLPSSQSSRYGIEGFHGVIIIHTK